MNKKIILTISAVAAFGISSLSFGMNIRDAIIAGNLQEVKRLVTKENINKYIRIPNSTDKETPLNIACECNKLDIVKELLEHENIDVDKGSAQTTNTNKFSPLEVAFEKGNLDIVKLLIKKGCSPYICYRCSVAGSYTKNYDKMAKYLNLAIDYNDSPDRAKFLEDIEKGRNKAYADLEDAYKVLAHRSMIKKPLKHKKGDTVFTGFGKKMPKIQSKKLTLEGEKVLAPEKSL